jgi:hypothetical protein
VISPLYLVKDKEGYFITCINGGQEWLEIPIVFWSERVEECRWDRWHGEFTFGNHFFTYTYYLSEEAIRSSPYARIYTIFLVAKGIYRKVCEWRGQELHPMIEKNHNDLQPLSS